MENIVYLNIASEFSAYPAGRVDADGPYNGSKFRDSLLAPKLKEAIQKNGKLVVSLAGLKSFGSSFLEEAFGGLVRNDRGHKKTFLSSIEIDPGSNSNLRYKEAIIRYINNA